MGNLRDRLQQNPVEKMMRQPVAGACFPARLFRTDVVCDLAVATRESSLAQQLRTFYEVHNPAKVAAAAQVARMFEGRLAELNSRLQAQYGAELAKSVQKDSDSSSDSECDK